MASMAIPNQRAPADLSHHFNTMSRKRVLNKMKSLYKYFGAPGMTNLAGGVCCAAFSAVAGAPAYVLLLLL